jgi:hypothetical protein
VTGKDYAITIYDQSLVGEDQSICWGKVETNPGQLQSLQVTTMYRVEQSEDAWMQRALLRDCSNSPNEQKWRDKKECKMEHQGWPGRLNYPKRLSSTASWKKWKFKNKEFLFLLLIRLSHFSHQTVPYIRWYVWNINTCCDAGDLQLCLNCNRVLVS